MTNQRSMRVLRIVPICCSAVALLLLVPRIALADKDDHKRNFSAVPEISVGNGQDDDSNLCGPGYPAGSNIVTSAWLGGMGLPDNGGANTTALDLATNPNKRDPHTGLLLSKNGPTPDCSSAEARIEGWDKGDVITELGFDYRNGGHCGGGAPRFNITTTDGSTYFAGCGTGLKTPAPQDPTQWTRVRFGSGGGPVFPGGPTDPPFVFGPGGTRVERIDIVYDEGTDIPGTEDPNGVGLAVIDNIDINETLITRGSGVCPGEGGSSCPGGRNRGRGSE